LCGSSGRWVLVHRPSRIIFVISCVYAAPYVRLPLLIADWIQDLKVEACVHCSSETGEGDAVRLL
jgi:hypothetical protein